MLDLAKYKLAYKNQKNGARLRGISWELNFDEWLAWWGEDIEKRGPGRWDLQMQRVADTGPYALWNIRKGTPKRNMATRSAVQQNKASLRAKAIVQERLNAAMWEPSKEDYDPISEDEEFAREMGIRDSRGSFGHYAKDKICR